MIKALKRSWARVNKDALPAPLFAPRFAGAPGSKADWDALLAHVIELHNAEKLPGFITCGARKAGNPMGEAEAKPA